jgi:hypothetical protein
MAFSINFTGMVEISFVISVLKYNSEKKHTGGGMLHMRPIVI